MIKAYAEPNRHFVEVKLGTEEMSDPLLIADAAKYEEGIYQPTDNIPADNILNFEDYVRTHKE